MSHRLLLPCAEYRQHMFGFTFNIFAPPQCLSVDCNLPVIGCGFIIQIRDKLTEEAGQCIRVQFTQQFCQSNVAGRFTARFEAKRNKLFWVKLRPRRNAAFMPLRPLINDSDIKPSKACRGCLRPFLPLGSVRRGVIPIWTPFFSLAHSVPYRNFCHG